MSQEAAAMKEGPEPPVVDESALRCDRASERITRSHQIILRGSMAVQGLLAAFGEREVRIDFLNGLLGSDRNSERMLTSIDAFRSMLLPRPGATTGNAGEDRANVLFLTKLLTDDSDEPEYSGGPLPCRQSFRQWSMYFSALLSCNYWQRNYSSGTAEESQDRTAVPAAEECQQPSAGARSRVKSERRSGERWSGGGRRSRQKDTSSSSSSSLDTCCESSSDSIASDSRRRKSGARGADRLERALEKLKFTREVVSPGVFTPKLGVSLKVFLRDFERYFDSKYEGSERDKSRQLGSFLAGSVKRTYEAIKGYQWKYKDLKPELLRLYKSGRSGAREERYREFQNATLPSGESVRLFCMQLERLASKAFPDSSVERERQLRRKILETAPKRFLSQLEAARNTLSILGESKLNWKQIKQVAESVDRSHNERGSCALQSDDCDEPQVWYSRPLPPREDDKRVSFKPANYGPSARTKVFSRSIENERWNDSRNDSRQESSSRAGNQTVARRPRRRATGCYWCGLSGHIEANCWRKLGRCHQCGGDHSTSDCDAARSGRAPVCSRCRGPHLGMNCDTAVNEATN